MGVRGARVSTVFIAIIGVTVVVLRDVIRERSERNRFARIEAVLTRALQTSLDSPTGSPYRDAPVMASNASDGHSSEPSVADVFKVLVDPSKVPSQVARKRCASVKYTSRCPGLSDPRCVAENCTEHCNEHCGGSCRGNVRFRGS